MYVESCTILVVVNHLSRPVMVLDGLPSLYGFKYDSPTACGLPLYLYSYKLVGSATLIVLVEVFDGVGVVGAWALHELVKVARRVLLGLSARVIYRGGQRGVGRSAAILSVLFPLYMEGPSS